MCAIVTLLFYYNNGLVQIEMLHLKTHDMMLVPLFLIMTLSKSTDRRVHFR